MKRIVASTVFLMAVVGASVFGWVESVGLPGTLPTDTRASLAESTVRAYYLGVRMYLDSGDMAAVRDVVDPVLLEPADAVADTAELGLYLRGLRGTYPDAAISVEEVAGNGETVVARIEIDHGISSVRPISPRDSLPSWKQIDTFRVEHGSIVDWQSTGRSSGLFAPSPGDAQALTIHERSTMTLARISFAGGDSEYVAIRAPALLLPERGSVRFRGNGLAVVATAEHPLGQVAEPEHDITVHPDESILLPGGSISLRAGSDSPASLIVVLFVPENSPLPDHETHSAFPPPEQLLAAASSGQIGRGISIELLDRAADTVRGTVQIAAGIAYIASDSAMVVDSKLRSVVIGPRTGSRSSAWDVTAGDLVLDGNGPGSAASVWVASLRPAPAAELRAT
jgi:hypothetical protein